MARSRYGQATAGDELQFIVFRLGTQELALDIFQVVRILPYAPPALRPGAPAFVGGWLQYDGAPVPLIDLRTRFGLPAEVQEETRIMVLDLEGRRIGVVVDFVREALRVDTRMIGRPDGDIPGVPPDLVSGVVHRPGRSIAIISGARLLGPSERQALAEVRA
ncbi:MAG: chemotaxis protein CheW [Gemmatimonadota bacterium]|nr:chemotaxis protein CheW [Gemmatimonadota bacterium]